jgi:ribosomal-protein-alanine N-acetyltransferase
VKSFHNIQTNRLLLRQILDADKPKVFEGLSHPEVIKHYGVNYKTLEDTQIQMDWFRTIWEEQTGIWWGVALLGKPEELIGAVGINNWNQAHHHAEIGFWLLPAFQQQGLMKEAATGMIHYLFTQTNLHRIYAMVETDNQASLGLLEKLGFKKEGRQREVEWKNGKYIDLDWFGLLRHEVGGVPGATSPSLGRGDVA